MNYHQLMLENHTLFTKHVFHRLAPYALSSGQPRVLEYLARHDGAVQKDIAHACMIEPPSVTSVLSRMEKEGLIQRGVREGDRRSQYVTLTAKGKELAQRTLETFREEEESALGGLSGDETQTLLRLLEKINRNLKQTL